MSNLLIKGQCTCSYIFLDNVPSHVNSSYWIRIRNFVKLLYFVVEMDTLPSQATKSSRKWLSIYITLYNNKKNKKGHKCTYWNLSANSMNDSRNFLSNRSLSRGSLGSITRIFSLRDRRPLSGIPSAIPIVLQTWWSFFLKLINETSGWDIETEKKATTRILAWKHHNRKRDC